MPTRFWNPLGKSYWDDDGYLRDPDEFPELSKDQRTLDQLADEPCLLLLGEPGIGKSTVLREQLVGDRTMNGSDLCRRLDLKSIDSVGLDSDVFHSRWFATWRDGSHQLNLWLDSLDECLGRVEHITSKLLARLEELDDAERQRLKLRIACRTGQLPARLPGELKTLWNNRLGIYELLPLRRKDVEAEVRGRRPQDAEPFLQEVDRRQLGVLASRPITLKLLLRIAAGQPLPADRAQIYQRGCWAFCEDPDSDRLSNDRRRRRLDTGVRLRIAEYLAAAMVLSQRLSIVLDEEQAGEQTRQAITLRELRLAENALSPAAETWREPDYLEVLTDTGLFTAGTHGCMVWQHQTYAEYLAASWLAQQPFHEIERLSLLSASTGDLGQVPVVVESQREVAAWLARLRPALCDRLIQDQPAVLLGSDMALQDDRGRALLVDRLLAQYASGARQTYDWHHEHYRGLAHPTLADQLRPFLRDQTLHSVAREVAICVAWGCEEHGSVDDIVAIAMSSDESQTLRTLAVRGLVEWADRTTLEMLRPLAQLDENADPSDQIAGLVLQALWSQGLLLPADVLKQLHPPRRANYLGAYYSLHHDLAETWPPDALPVALEWALQQPRLREVADCTGRLVLKFAQLAAHHIDKPGVLPALARLAIARLRRDEDPFRGAGYVLSEKFNFPSDESRRQIIGAILPSPDFHHRVVYRWFFHSAYWLSNDDTDWLIQEVRAADAEQQPRWIALLREFCHQRIGLPPDAVITASHEIPVLYAAFEGWLRPVEIDSDLARTQRANYERHAALIAERQQTEEAQEKQRASWKSLQQQVSDVIEQARQQDQLAWRWLGRLCVDEEGGLSTPSSASGKPKAFSEVWGELGDACQRQLLHAAMLYLVNAKSEGELVSYPQPHCVQMSEFCGLGFAALRLLLDVQKLELSSLSPSLWARWVPVVVRYPWAHGWPGRARLWALAFAGASAEFLAALRSLLDDFDVPNRASQFDALAGIDPVHAGPIGTMLLEWAMARRASNLAVGPLYGVLLQLQTPQILAWVESQVRPPVGADSLARAEAVAAGSALLCRLPSRGWDALRPLFGLDAPLLLSILQDADHIFGGRREGTWLARMRDEDLADLCILLHRHYTGDEDEQDFDDEAGERRRRPRNIREARIIGPRQSMYQLRDTSLRELASRTRESAIIALERLAATLPTTDGMLGLLELRRDALRNRLYAESHQTLAGVAKRIAELRRAARERLRGVLRTDADVNAFAIDYCPEVRARFTDSMDGLKKLDIFLDMVEPDDLQARLQQWRQQGSVTT